MYTANKIRTSHPAFRQGHIHSRVLLILCLLFAINAALPVTGYAATQVSQFGITWTFDKDYTVGQFANGDWWVIGPVNVTSINPGWDGEKHGSMINPMPLPKQAYDIRLSSSYPFIPFDADLLVTAPVTLDPNTSLVSVESRTETKGLNRAAVLTVLGEVPPDNGATVFRPPYPGSDKPLYSTSDLETDMLEAYSDLDVTGQTYRPSWFFTDEGWARDNYGRFDSLWLDHMVYAGRMGGDYIQYMSPSSNMPAYGREYSTEIGRASLVLLTDEQQLITAFGEDKQELLIHFVQIGIDLHHVVENGGYWWPGGGLDHGRKWMILFAGLMLDNVDMKNIGIISRDMPYDGFQEDCQTFYVSQSDVDSGTGGYVASDIGLPEWGDCHCDNIGNDVKDWSENPYRECCTANSWAGIALSAHIMGVKGLWNHNAFFDYQDRYMDVQLQTVGQGAWKRQWDDFTEEMWDTYRADYGCVWTPYDPTDMYSNGYNPCTSDTIPPLPPSNLDSTNRTESSISLSWTAPGPASDGDLASRYKIYRNGPLVDTVTNTSFQDTGLAAGTSYDYKVYSVDNAGNQSLSAAEGTFSTSVDSTPPSIVSVSASETSVEITFSESLDTMSAEDINNYSITGGISVIAALLDTDTVTLTTSAHTEGTYTLTVENVEDTSGNPMTGTTTYEYNGGLAAHWKFDDGSGNSALDSSGNNNTGTLINGPVWTGQGELSFDGIDDAVEIPTANWDVSSGTVTLWAKAADISGTRYLFGHTVGSWSNRIQLYADEGSFCLGLGDSHSTSLNIENLALQTWYHIALTWDGTDYVVYVDGIAKASGPYTGLTELNTSADIGNTGNISYRDEAFNGIIDEVRIYNRALIADEVSNLALVFLPIDDKEIEEGSTLTFEVRTKDPNQEVFIEASPNLPFEPNDVFFSNIFTWTPQYGNAGSYEVTFEAPHGEFVDFETITITVHKPTKPVYRFWSPTNSRHFYTIKESEKDKLIDIYAHVWTYESIAYYAFAEDSEPGLVPVYRFWSPVLVAHFYTISESEKQKLIDRYSHVWTYEGIAFYAYPEGQQPGDAEVVYRFWSPVLETHFYTIRESEKNKLVDNYSHVWTYEGTAWYTYTSY